MEFAEQQVLDIEAGIQENYYSRHSNVGKQKAFRIIRNYRNQALRSNSIHNNYLLLCQSAESPAQCESQTYGLQTWHPNKTKPVVAKCQPTYIIIFF